MLGHCAFSKPATNRGNRPVPSFLVRERMGYPERIPELSTMNVRCGSIALKKARIFWVRLDNLSICETAFSFYLLPYGAHQWVRLWCPSVDCQRGHHNPSCKTGRRFVGPRSPDVFCQRLQILHNSCEGGTRRAHRRAPAGTHALRSMVGLQVRESASRPSCAPSRVIYRTPAYL